MKAGSSPRIIQVKSWKCPNRLDSLNSRPTSILCRLARISNPWSILGVLKWVTLARKICTQSLKSILWCIRLKTTAFSRIMTMSNPVRTRLSATSLMPRSKARASTCRLKNVRERIQSWQTLRLRRPTTQTQTSLQIPTTITPAPSRFPTLFPNYKLPLKAIVMQVSTTLGRTMVSLRNPRQKKKKNVWSASYLSRRIVQTSISNLLSFNCGTSIK